MDKINIILANLRNGVPQALARFNDGEMRAIIRVGDKVARGCQKVTQDLQDKLKEAIRHEQENYWKGLPCEVCWPRWKKHADFYVNQKYEFLTCAVVNTNRNLQKVYDEFPKAVEGKFIYWVSGNDQNLDNLEKETGMRVAQKVTLPKRNAWGDYPRIKDYYTIFNKGSIVVLSCGPLAEVLVKEWFQRRPDVTFLDMGSTFDPFTRGVRHGCHTGKLKPCRGCN